MQFFSNFPPPPVPTRESILNEGLKTFEQSKNDQQWIKTWIDTKKNELSIKKISLSNYRQRLIQHVHLLEKYEEELKNFNQENLKKLKNQIEQSNKFIYDEKIIQQIRKEIYRRKLKRTRLRRQKQIQIIETKHDLIESSSSTNEKSLEKKIEDINSLLQIISQLKQLKNIRQQGQIEENDNNELIEIENICTTKLFEYKNEIEQKSLSSQKELFNYLFNNNNQSFYQSINSDAQDFLRAHQNIKNLIEIRQQWDQYSSTQINSLDNMIPYQWYEPQLPTDKNWSEFIFNKNQ